MRMNIFNRNNHRQYFTELGSEAVYWNTSNFTYLIRCKIRHKFEFNNQYYIHIFHNSYHFEVYIV